MEGRVWIMKLRYVEYHGFEWMVLVETGWTTKDVSELPDSTRIASMYYTPPGLRARGG